MMTRRFYVVLAAVVVVSCAILGCLLTFPMLVSIRDHNRLAEDLSDVVSRHATAHFALICNEKPNIQVGNLLGAGGEECDVGVELSCAGMLPERTFDVDLSSVGVCGVDVRTDSDRIVLTSFINSLEPDADPRCW